MEFNNFEKANSAHERLSDIKVFENPDFPNNHFVSFKKEGESYMVRVGNDSTALFDLSIPENAEIMNSAIENTHLSPEEIKKLTDEAEIELSYDAASSGDFVNEQYT